MRYSIISTIAALASTSFAEINVSDFSIEIAASQGLGATSGCQVRATLDRGNEPVNYYAVKGCGEIQDNGSSFDEFEEGGGIEIRVSCSVINPQECARAYTVEVRTDDGECGIGKVQREDCPVIDFRNKRSYPPPSGLSKRQDPPVEYANAQCYGDLTLDPC